jgi:hypothetical protein
VRFSIVAAVALKEKVQHQISCLVGLQFFTIFYNFLVTPVTKVIHPRRRFEKLTVVLIFRTKKMPDSTVKCFGARDDVRLFTVQPKTSSLMLPLGVAVFAVAFSLRPATAFRPRGKLPLPRLYPTSVFDHEQTITSRSRKSALGMMNWDDVMFHAQSTPPRWHRPLLMTPQT